MSSKAEEKAKAKFEKKKAKAAKKKKEPRVRIHQNRDKFIRQVKYWSHLLTAGFYRNTACRLKFHWWSKYAEPKKINVRTGYREVRDGYYNRIKQPVFENRDFQFRICHCCNDIGSKEFSVKVK